MDQDYPNNMINVREAAERGRKSILMCKQILPTSTITNVQRTVRRTCMLILGLRVLMFSLNTGSRVYLNSRCTVKFGKKRLI